MNKLRPEDVKLTEERKKELLTPVPTRTKDELEKNKKLLDEVQKLRLEKEHEKWLKRIDRYVN